jgi:hypothetical protein
VDSVPKRDEPVARFATLGELRSIWVQILKRYYEEYSRIAGARPDLTATTTTIVAAR